MRWKGLPLYAEVAQSARKFSAVFGTDSQKISNLRSPREVWSYGWRFSLCLPVFACFHLLTVTDMVKIEYDFHHFLLS